MSSSLLLLSNEAFTQLSGPVNQMVCLNDTAVFILEHSFDYETFTWEESNDNVNFTPISASAGYSGIDSDMLFAYTGALNPSASGIWRYYRCHVFSSIYGWTYSETAYLEINIPPVIDFTWTNPCQEQTIQFDSEVVSTAAPFKYHWTFDAGPSAVSVYADPTFTYASAGTYNVTLTVTDVKGCKTSLTKVVDIFSIPIFNITGKEVVCSNELGVKYSTDIEGENVQYNWNISGFGTIEDNSLREISIDWNAVTVPTQTKIILTVTIDPPGCSKEISNEILITTYVAPPEGTVFRKPEGSTLLIYYGPEVNSYRWGYTDNTGNDYYIDAEKGGERFYCDFMTLDPVNTYWVETSYDSRINCVTRSYFDFGSGKIGKTVMDDEFTIYPVPASGQLTVRFNEDINPAGISIYNLMMQKVYENTNPEATSGEITISAENLKSGIYIIRVSNVSSLSNYRVFTIEK